MSELSNPLVWTVALVICATAFLLTRSFLLPEARERRRRKRNHGRVVSKVARPMVSLAVETKPGKDR